MATAASLKNHSDSNNNNILILQNDIHLDVPIKKNVVTYEDPFVTDVWIGLILTMMAFICVGYLCTCLAYHKFKRWKRQLIEAQRRAEAASATHDEEVVYEESLPSYTIVTGLPSYDEAMKQLRELRIIRRASLPKILEMERTIDMPSTTFTVTRLSLGDLFQFYNKNNEKALPN